jgi:hypothetical protein
MPRFRRRGSPFGCVASEGGAPFVARRAMNLHGCAPASRAPFPQIPAFKSGCAASEGRASFVARRAVNLHGCALPHSALPPAAAPPYLLGAQPLRERNPGGRPHCAPRSSYAGVPQGVLLVREWGAPPPPATPPDPPARHRPPMDLCGVWYGRRESL